MAGGMFVPQMVAPTGSDPLSGLANLTNRIGQWREDAQLADIMKGFDPANPYSYEDTLHRLGTSGIPGGRDMQDRILGIAEARRKAQETEQTGTYHQGTLDVARQRLKMEQDIYKAGLENTKWGQQFLQNAPPQPGAGDVPGSTVTPPETEGPKLPPSKWEPAAPAAAPRPRSMVPPSAAPDSVIAPQAAAAATAPTRTAALAAPMGGAPVSDTGGVGFAAESVPGQPGVQRAGGLLATGPAPVEAPVQTAARGGVGGTRAVPPPPTGLPPPTAPAPVITPPSAPEVAPVGREPSARGSLPVPGLVKTAPETISKEEDTLNRWIDYYTRGSANLRDPSQIKAVDKIIDQLTKRRDEISGARQESAKEEARIRRELGQEINKKEADALDKLKESTNKEAFEVNDLRNSTDALVAISDHPNYFGGPLGAPAQLISGMAMGWRQIAEKLADMTGTKVNKTADEFIKGYVTDVNTRRAQAGSIGNAITLKLIGGSLGNQISNPDRVFVHRIGANEDDTKEGIKAKSLLINELVDRVNKTASLVNDLSDRGYTTTQIKEEIRKQGEARRSFRNADGTLTELGRQISPQMDKEEEDKRIAGAARIAAQEGPGIELGKRADAAAMAAGVNLEGNRATPQGAADRPETPPGPGKRALIEALGPEKGEAAHAAIGQARAAAQSTINTVAPIAREVARRAIVEPAREMLAPVTNDIRDLFRGPRSLPPPPAAPPATGAGVTQAPAASGYNGPGAPLPPAQDPRGYRGPGAPLPLPPASQAAAPSVAPAPLPGDVAQPAAAVVGAPPLTAGERFDQWVRGKINPAEAIPRPEAPAPRPTPIEAAVVPGVSAQRRGELLNAARARRGLPPIAPVPPPSRAWYEDAPGMEYTRASGEAGLRRSPEGLDWQRFRRSGNVEVRPEEYPSLISNYPNSTQEDLRGAMLRGLPARGRLSDQGGLADLEAYAQRPNLEFGRRQAIAEGPESRLMRIGDEERLRGLIARPLPKPRDNSAAGSKATVERENRRRDRRTPE